MAHYCNNCMNKIETGTICEDCLHKQIKTASSHHLTPGTVLHEQYLIGNAIGEGGFGVTYIGRDLTLDIKIAVKEFYPAGYANRDAKTTNEVTLVDGEQKKFVDAGKARFLEEARNIARFSGDPGIVTVRSFFEENGTAYIVMEYLDGVTLTQHFKRNGPMDAESLIQKMLPIMESLQKLHAAGLIHRDISPDNIMMTGDGRLKLMDFGAARYFKDSDQNMSVLIRHGYAPAEQYRTNCVQGPYTDVYALCATLYKCITGVTPNNSLDRLYKDELKTPSELGFRISANYEEALMLGLEADHTKRCQTMGELIRLFKAAQPVMSQTEMTNDQTESASMHVSSSTAGSDMTVYADAPDFNQMNSTATTTPVSREITSLPDPSSEQKDLSKRSGNAKLWIFICAAIILIGIVIYFEVSKNSKDGSEPVSEEPTRTVEEVATSADADEEAEDADSESAETTETIEPVSELESESSADITVPDLIGKPCDESESILSALGLQAETVEKESAESPAGYVVSQNPIGNNKVSKGDVVTLYVAKATAEQPNNTNQVTGYVSASDWVSLRVTPSRSASKLCEIPYNTPVTIILESRTDEWTHIIYDGKEGYALTEFLSYSENPTPNYGDGSAQSNPAASGTVYLYCRATEWATLRQEPSTKAAAVTTIPCRDSVIQIAVVGDFYYVSYGTLTGYVLRSYFSTDPNASLKE